MNPVCDRVLGLLACGLVIAASGCAVVSRGAADRSLRPHAAPPPMNAHFHGRDTVELEREAKEYPKTITRWVLDDDASLESLKPEYREMVTKTIATVEESRPVGQGIVRTFRFTEGPLKDRTAFVSKRRQPDASESATDAAKVLDPFNAIFAWDAWATEQNVRTMKSLPDPPPIRPVPPEIRWAPYGGVEIVRPPVPVGTSSRGLIVLMPPLGGGGYVKHGLAELVNRGWSVLEVRTQRLVGIGNDLTASTIADAADAGRLAAWLVDEQLSEAAYAVEAGLKLTYEAQPDLLEQPLVLVGVSAGALMVPPVAQFLRRSDELPDPAAAVIVAGGANLLDAGQRSALGAGVRIRYLTGDSRAPVAAERAYLETSTLDPYWTAGALVDMPVLQVHAALDDIVPAACGELLWNRLGRPDRWTYPVGHRVLFLMMRDRGSDIADWIERAAADARGAANAPYPVVR